MQLTNSLHPSELFRYVHLRGARKPAQATLLQYVSYQSLVQTPSEDSLYARLLLIKDSADAFSEAETLCSSFKESSNYVASSEQIAERLPKLKDLYYAACSTLSYQEGAVTEAERILGSTLSSYHSTYQTVGQKEILWDNLVYQVITEEKLELISSFTGYLVILNFLDELPNIATQSKWKQLLKARLLLPEWLVKVVQAEKQKTGDTGVGTVERTVSEIPSLQLKYKKLLADLWLLRTYKLNFPPSGENVDIMQLTTSDIERLSAESQTFLATLNVPTENIDINKLIDYLAKAANAQSRQTGTANRNKVVKVGGSVLRTAYGCFTEAEDSPCDTKERKIYQQGGSYVSNMYVGDLLVTKQQLLRYDIGEVAHIENVMAKETRTRTHRRLSRSEITQTYERENENETERETQTTERFSIEKEISKAVQQSVGMEAGVKVSASYGPTVGIEAHTGFSYNASSSQTSNEATAYAKEMSDRALTRVKEKVRETKTVTLINEIEEIAGHTFDNTADDSTHINGVFCWVDKYYLNKVVNYGKRLMLDFTIPEPANYYLFRKANAGESDEARTEPIHPKEEVKGKDSNGNEITIKGEIKSFHDISFSNYAEIAAFYGVGDVEIPPLGYKTVGKAIKVEQTNNPTDATIVDEKILIPKGYIATFANIQINFTGEADTGFSLFVGDKSIGGAPSNITNATMFFGISQIDSDVIPVSLKVWAYFPKPKHAIANIVVWCVPTAEIMLSWQQGVYAKIMEAYNQQKKEYDEWLNAQNAYSGYNIQGNNPEINRQIEREELKKRCIEMFTGQRFESFDAATNGLQNVSNYPEILFKEAISEGRIVQALEQAFDWENMTYVFYPYFYGRKPNWKVLTQLSDTDPVFTKFLQAGYAKAIVPVRKGFEEYVMYYHALAVLFIGGEFAQIPCIESDKFQTLLEDIHSLNDQPEHEAEYDEGNVIGTYIQKVPTNLVFLKEALPNNSTLSSLTLLPNNLGASLLEIDNYVTA